MTTISITAERLNEINSLLTLKEQFEVKTAKMHDFKVQYSYELLTGVTEGDILVRKGTNIYHPDLKESFENLDVFLAHIDGAFESWANNQTPLQELEADEKLQRYSVLDFRITGNEENKSVIIIGEKNTSYGVMRCETPKIKLESTNYLYIEELNERILQCQNEVLLYMSGKKEKVEDDPNQVKMTFEENESIDFDNAKLDD